MARIYTVKSFRGQRKCQKEIGEWSRCNEPRTAHYDEQRDLLLGHHFLQIPLRCDFCGKDINVGDPYKWTKPRAHRATSGRKRTRHTSCPSWKPSETTSSQHLAIIYGAQEAAEASLGDVAEPDSDDFDNFLEAVQDVVREFGSNVREAADTYRESAEAISEGFGHATQQSEELEGNAQAVEDWAEQAEWWTPTVDDYDSVIADAYDVIGDSPV